MVLCKKYFGTTAAQSFLQISFFLLILNRISYIKCSRTNLGCKHWLFNLTVVKFGNNSHALTLQLACNKVVYINLTYEYISVLDQGSPIWDPGFSAKESQISISDPRFSRQIQQIPIPEHRFSKAIPDPRFEKSIANPNPGDFSKNLRKSDQYGRK